MNHTPSDSSHLKKALVVARSSYAPGWEWYFYSEEVPGLFSAFVKSPLCPDGEYGLVSSEELQIPWLMIEQNPSSEFDPESFAEAFSLMRRIGVEMTKTK